MDLDDQLAALAAGELDPEQTRALEARVASDPALARRLARIVRLDEVLQGWDAPELSRDAVGRLDAAVADALAALPDAPLVAAEDATPIATPLSAHRDSNDHEQPAALPGAATRDGATSDELAARRGRRTAGGVPRWVAGLGVAAAAVVVVGGGTQALMGTFSANDAAEEPMASQVADDTAEMDAADQMAGSAMADDMDATGQLYASRSDLTLTDETLGELADDIGIAQRLAEWFAADGSASELTPSQSSDLALLDDADAAGDAPDSGSDVAESDPNEPLDAPSAATGATTTSSTGTAEEAARSAAACLGSALGSGQGEVVLVGDGTYEGTPATFVVLVRFEDDGTPILTTQAYDDSCTLLATRTR